MIIVLRIGKGVDVRCSGRVPKLEKLRFFKYAQSVQIDPFCAHKGVPYSGIGAQCKKNTSDPYYGRKEWPYEYNFW